MGNSLSKDAQHKYVEVIIININFSHPYRCRASHGSASLQTTCLFFRATPAVRIMQPPTPPLQMFLYTGWCPSAIVTTRTYTNKSSSPVVIYVDSFEGTALVPPPLDLTSHLTLLSDRRLGGHRGSRFITRIY